ncbi:MAG: phosphatase PAP2 family protein [Acidobacteria bacterium]|nr:phosphatase PAP2 family protein [Acidobacteriota bacterium]
MAKSSKPFPWYIPLLLAVVALALAMLTPRLPGDVEVARSIQRLGIGPGPAATIGSLVARPVLYGLLGVGVLLATWRARVRGLLVTVALMLIWWYAGEPLKILVGRSRPSPSLIEVVTRSSGFSFPSTFATMWYSTWLPVATYAWRSRARPGGTVLAALATCAILAGAWARIRVGAHWPSDLLLTLVLVWAVFALLDGVAARLRLST